jgi:hypothetical protein
LKTRIFQSYFLPEQLSQIDPLITPFDNTTNTRPELREYHLFKRAIDEGHTNDLDMWGMLGPRWQEKVKYPAIEMWKSIENAPAHDVYIFNHARVVNALTTNVWEQGEYFHKGIKQVARYALEKVIGSGDVVDVLMTDSVTCYCSYFVATKEFWQDYIRFLDQIKAVLDNLPPELNRIYQSSAGYGRDLTLNLFPFIIERMFSTYLSLTPKWKVYRRPYDYSVYANQTGEFYKVLDALNLYKSLGPKLNSPELFTAWNTMRLHFVRQHPTLFNLD